MMFESHAIYATPIRCQKVSRPIRRGPLAGGSSDQSDAWRWVDRATETGRAFVVVWGGSIFRTHFEGTDAFKQYKASKRSNAIVGFYTATSEPARIVVDMAEFFEGQPWGKP